MSDTLRFGDGREEELDINEVVGNVNVGYVTKRERIASLISQLTYREMMLIEEEFQKIEPSLGAIAHVLDQWAHKVEEENDPSRKGC